MPQVAYVGIVGQKKKKGFNAQSKMRLRNASFELINS